ncbi:hypothetical protein B0H13DRAFT_315035 [Mycena leptocephala]|nr:hypothetical protein B0H13DRAFT_315035 [Mycena leptocephala]
MKSPGDVAPRRNSLSGGRTQRTHADSTRCKIGPTRCQKKKLDCGSRTKPDCTSVLGRGNEMRLASRYPSVQATLISLLARLSAVQARTDTRHPTPLANRDYLPPTPARRVVRAEQLKNRKISRTPPSLYFQYQLRSLGKMRNPNLHLHPGAPTPGLHVDDGRGVRAQQMKDPEKDTAPPSPSNSAASSQAQVGSPHRGDFMPSLAIALTSSPRPALLNPPSPSSTLPRPPQPSLALLNPPSPSSTLPRPPQPSLALPTHPPLPRPMHSRGV